MLMRSRRALRRRAVCQRDLKLKLIMLLSIALCWSDIVVARSRIVRSAQPAEQGNDDSDGGVKLIARKAKTYVGPDMVNIDGKDGRGCVRRYSDNCPSIDGSNELQNEAERKMSQEKRIRSDQEVVGRIWRMEDGGVWLAQPRLGPLQNNVFLLSRQDAGPNARGPQSPPPQENS